MFQFRTPVEENIIVKRLTCLQRGSFPSSPTYLVLRAAISMNGDLMQQIFGGWLLMSVAPVLS
jgi:hypothetical protein